MQRKTLPRNIAALALALSLAPPALAQQASSDYPNKPIRVVAPFGTGGLVDVLSRAIAE